MVFLLGSIYGLLYHYFDIDVTRELPRENDKESALFLDSINKWISSHYALATIIMIPFASISSYWAFYKKEYNLVEHLILNSFITGQKLVVSLLLFPFVYMASKTSSMLSVFGATMVIDFILTAWTYNQFFNTQSRIKNFLKTLLSYVIFYGFYLLVIILIVVFYFLFIKR